MTDVAAPAAAAPSTGGSAQTTPQPTTSAAPSPSTSSAKPTSQDVSRETSTSGDVTGAGKKEDTPAQAAAKKLWKYKVDEQDVEEELSDEDVTKLIQKGKGADKRFEEANTKESHIKAALKKFFEDPIAFLEDKRSGFTEEKVREVLEKALYKRVQRDTMDPKDRELEDLKREREERLAIDKKSEEEKKQTELKTREGVYVKNISESIINTLSAPESGLPQTPESVKRIAIKLKTAVQKGIRPEMAKIVEDVRNDYVKEHVAVMGKMTGEQVFKLMGEEFFKKVREYDISRLRTNPPPTNLEGAIQKRKSDKIESWQDWQNSRRKR